MLDSDKNMLVLPDNGGRGSGFNRRQVVYTDYIPCRRIIGDRRSGRDRRSGMDRRKTSVYLEGLNIPERRGGKDRRKASDHGLLNDVLLFWFLPYSWSDIRVVL